MVEGGRKARWMSSCASHRGLAPRLLLVVIIANAKAIAALGSNVPLPPYDNPQHKLPLGPSLLSLLDSCSCHRMAPSHPPKP
ncbi:hypothetical protein Nepgr_011219 [Nepenthes gracilis]|uniref:Uncharacterized protein n=1 Tax=Nepenthes gracilis TaxID=150966 RepID=A0AAD3SDT5_NEPGR|nr:hypothetical protein Nepgr_011219 [Nepenthes gracilis]